MADALAFWLIPTHETRDWFTSQIASLSERFGATTFEPHLTVHVGSRDTLASAASLIAESAFDFPPITLRTLGLSHSAEFTKTLFLEFHNTPELIALSTKMRERLPSDYTLSPHLSLLYFDLPEDTRVDLVREIKVPFDEVRFEILQAVSMPSSVTTGDDVRRWKIEEEWRI